MNRFTIAALAATTIIFSCKGNPAGGKDAAEHAHADSVEQASLTADSLVLFADEPPMPEAADELFDDFFFNFVESPTLQKARITFPLTHHHDGASADTIRRADWQTEPFFLPQGFYTLILDSEQQIDIVKDTTVDSVVVEQILFNIQTVKQYFFRRIRKIWKLTAINSEPFYKNPNSSFLSFYQQFSADSLFQIESLHSPVAFSGPDPDDDFRRMEGVISPDSWFAFAPDMPQTVIYNIVYGSHGEATAASNRKIFVVRGISNGEETEMTFERRAGAWKLTRLDM